MTCLFQNGPISSLNLQSAVHKSETIDDEEKIAVCKFAKGFVPEEANAEITMDGKKLMIIIHLLVHAWDLQF